MILVAGGTGRLGTLLVRRLATAGVSVRVITRDRDRAAHLSDAHVEVVAGVDVRDPDSLARAVRGAEIVVSAVQGFAGPGRVSPASVDRDGNIHLIDAARAAGAQCILMSTDGAAADSPMELFRMKYAAEQYLRASGVPSTIVRSTAFLELWRDLLEGTAATSGRPLVFGRGDNPINFVPVDNVAALLERVINDPSTRGHILRIGGPDNLTLNQLAAATQAAAGRTGAPRHVPSAVLRLIKHTAGPFKPQLARQARAALIMDRMDLAFDPATADPAPTPP